MRVPPTLRDGLVLLGLGAFTFAVFSISMLRTLTLSGGWYALGILVSWLTLHASIAASIGGILTIQTWAKTYARRRRERGTWMELRRRQIGTY